MESAVALPRADEAQAADGPPNQSNGGEEDFDSNKKANLNGTNRKRTKTGCLTCRKRRIKCDEGRPTCNNCIKSKRACEGYNQRVVFKDPIGAHSLHSDPFGPLDYIYGATHPLNQLASRQARSSGRGPLPTIAPRPPTFDYQHHQPHNFQYGVPLPSGLPGQVPYAPHVAFDFGINPYPAANTFMQQPNSLAFSSPAAGYWHPDQQFHTHNLPQASHSQDYYALEQITIAGQQGTALEPSRSLPLLGPQLSILPMGNAQPEFHERSDEEASMVDSDDVEQEPSSLMSPIFMGMYGHNSRDVSLRSFSTFARNDTVGEYMNSPHASELKDDAKRKLFEHFMRVTGPTMSLYERHFFEPTERNVTDDRGGNIWSYKFPVLSFHHPALLHAILALSSLQVSKLQNNSPTAALKHYHIALRRVAKNVTTPSRRLRLATLAAALLLAYYEVWNSEHTKWCSHLYGARTLFAEIPLREIARRCLPARSLADRRRIMKEMGPAGAGGPLPPDPNALDFDLLTTITGYPVAADDYCLREDQLFQSVESTVTERDIENFESLRDLFWWYCKMDVYQAMLGGAKLFMDYENWVHCLPRAPVSKLDGCYGTYDHLMLLLGRLTKFSANDQPRKLRASRAKDPHRGNSPPFPGMVPTQATVPLPMGFSPRRSTEHRDDSNDEVDPQVTYQAALQEWESIRRAFGVLESRLGPEFQPLSSEYADRRDHPFGPALQYRTYSVAGIWMNFYAGLIHLHRSHPDMPPTAMQSVGFSARKTAGYANMVGRIAVGLSDDCSSVTEISTVLAAAFLESSMCLFVAAVQFQDDSQRRWLVRRMHDITRLTGWQSAKQIADGCESAWTRAAQFGRGPPYMRTSDSEDAKQSIWNNHRRIDQRIMEADCSAGGEGRVVLARAERAHYALGLLGVEDDFEYLELKDEAFNRDAAHVP